MADRGQGKITRMSRLAQAFTPRAPVVQRDLFAGRHRQLARCLMALGQPGLHVAVYGERGVGKTSLANVLPAWITELNRPDVRAVRINCDVEDNFSSIWTKAFRELRDPWREADGSIDPEAIRFRLESDERAYLIVLDELDRIKDSSALTLLADTVKTMSDHRVSTHLMLVGVAQSIEHLIGEHESVVRCLEQVEMPRMTSKELEQILVHGYGSVNMTIEDSANSSIIEMAEGLPHFAHLLGLSSGTLAIEDDRDIVVRSDVDRAIRKETETHTLMSTYRMATHSTQPKHLYEQVLVACAMAPKDELGYFRMSDVVRPLSAVLHRDASIQLLAPHLSEFTSQERGRVLHREGKPHRPRFRFRDPLLQPFAKLAALADGRVDQAVLDRFPARVPSEAGEDVWEGPNGRVE